MMCICGVFSLTPLRLSLILKRVSSSLFISKMRCFMAKKTVVRSAITGQFVKPIEAKRHPDTTVTETIKIPTKKAKK